MKTILLFALTLGALFGADAKYIVHWTSEEPCHECGTRTLLHCGGVPDCNVPRKTVDHFEVAGSKDVALQIANDISTVRDVPQYWSGYGSTGAWGDFPRIRATGTLVAIYESRPLPLDIRVETKEIPQPAKTKTKKSIAIVGYEAPVARSANPIHESLNCEPEVLTCATATTAILKVIQ